MFIDVVCLVVLWFLHVDLFARVFGCLLYYGRVCLVVVPCGVAFCDLFV